MSEYGTYGENNPPVDVRGIAPSAYHKKIRLDENGTVDVYAVLDAFSVTSQPLGHAIKKLLAAGQRNGGKSVKQDLEEAISSIKRAIELEE